MISNRNHLLGLWKLRLVFVAQSAAQKKQVRYFDLQEQAKCLLLEGRRLHASENLVGPRMLVVAEDKMMVQTAETKIQQSENESYIKVIQKKIYKKSRSLTVYGEENGGPDVAKPVI